MPEKYAHGRGWCCDSGYRAGASARYVARVTEPNLATLRDAIEALDRKLLGLLAERMRFADGIASAKLAAASPFRDPLREDQVLQRLRQAATGIGLDPHECERLYRVIMEMSVARQQAFVHELASAPLRVAYQGVEGAYSHLAAQRQYAGRAGGALLTGYDSFRGAAEAVRDGSVDVALLPVENTTAGSVPETYDLVAELGLRLNAEVVSRVEHCLLVLPGTHLEQVRTVISHAQALAQCEVFLRALPGVRVRESFDTAGAAHRVRDGGDRSVAALASETAARVYGLEVLERGIQTQAGNFTRFVEVAREARPCTADVPCRTTLLLTLAHQPGALGQVLVRFGERGVNLSRIESRPVPGAMFRYRFYLDLDAHAASAPVVAALADIAPFVSGQQLLGTYPAADDRNDDGARA